MGKSLSKAVIRNCLRRAAFSPLCGQAKFLLPKVAKTEAVVGYTLNEDEPVAKVETDDAEQILTEGPLS